MASSATSRYLRRGEHRTRKIILSNYTVKLESKNRSQVNGGVVKEQKSLDEPYASIIIARNMLSRMKNTNMM